MAQTEIIDTEGVTIDDIGSVPTTDRPAFSIALAVAWARKPENAPRIERVAAQARAVQDKIVHRIDDRITQMKDLLVDIATDDNVKDQFVDSFLKSLVGD